MNERGLRTRQYKNRGGREWTKGTIQDILKSRTYLGELPYQPVSKDASNKRTWDNPLEWTPGAHEPLVSIEVFDRCQQVMKSHEHNVNQGAVDGRYLLSGLVYCAKCQMMMDMENPQARMYGHAQKAKTGDEVYEYYMCKHTPSHGNPRAEVINQQLIDFLLSGHLLEDFDGKEKTIAAIATDYETAAIQQRIQEISDKIGRLDFRFDNGAFTGDPQAFLAERQRLEGDIAVLKFRVSDSYDYALSVMNDFPAHWHAAVGDFSVQQKLIKTVVHQVIVSNKQVAAVIIKPSHQIVFTHPVVDNADDDDGGSDQPCRVDERLRPFPSPLS